MSHLITHMIDDAHLWWDKGSRPIVFVDDQPGQNIIGTYNPATRSSGGSHSSYSSFAALQGNIPDGATVFVRGGTYRTSRVWWQGDFTQKVVVKPFLFESVVVKPPEVAYSDANWPLFLLSGHNIRFERLEFDGEMGTNVVGDAQLHGGHNYHYALGNVSTVAGACDWEAYGLVIHDFAHAGIKGGNWNIIEQNKICDIGFTIYDHAFYTFGSDIKFYFNWLSSIAGFGIHCYGAAGNDDITFFGNIVGNIGTCGDQTASAFLVNGNRAKLYHNIVSGSPCGFTSFGANLDGHDLQNNCFVNITNYNIRIENADSFGPTAVCTNNLFDPHDTAGYGCNQANTSVYVSTQANVFDLAVLASGTPGIPSDFVPGAGAPQLNMASTLPGAYNLALSSEHTTWPPTIARRSNAHAGPFTA